MTYNDVLDNAVGVVLDSTSQEEYRHIFDVLIRELVSARVNQHSAADFGNAVADIIAADVDIDAIVKACLSLNVDDKS